MTGAPAGAATLAAAPASAIRPSRITIVWSCRGGAPVPSMTVTCDSTTTGSLTDTKSRAPGDSVAADWAPSVPTAGAAETNIKPASARMDTAAR
jgi:hypothetical protein